MNATTTNHTLARRLPGMNSAIRLLAVQLLLVTILVSALVAFQPGIASADTGGTPATEQIPAPQGDPDACPFENNSIVNSNPASSPIDDGGTSTAQCLLPGIPC